MDSKHGTNLERLNRSIIVSLDDRITRRSFVGRMGRGLLVWSLAGTGVVALAGAAHAACNYDGSQDAPCGCGNGDCGTTLKCKPAPNHNCCLALTITCKDLTGTGGQCPANTSACGSWSIVNPTGCTSGNHIEQWTDCCGTSGVCDGGNNCQCVTGCDGELQPTCCRTKCYCGGFGSCGSAYIRCRFAQCVS